MLHAWERIRSVQGFGSKAEGKRPLGKPKRRWEDEIRMDLGEIGWGCKVALVGSGLGPVAGL
jgi:hypothetical protein